MKANSSNPVKIMLRNWPMDVPITAAKGVKRVGLVIINVENPHPQYPIMRINVYDSI